eukprot:15434992-Alexandrium_andersonii.AAC.2
MSASLVGSEMCIRDRSFTVSRAPRGQQPPAAGHAQRTRTRLRVQVNALRALMGSPVVRLSVNGCCVVEGRRWFD